MASIGPTVSKAREESGVIRPLMKMKFFLQRPSEPATADDLNVARDLVDTLESYRATCVGMAANMIGQRKCIIAVLDTDGSVLPMLNPQITSATGPYKTEEGCLSLEGKRRTTRYRRIVVVWEDLQFKPCKRAFEGAVAQAIQHEVDHCNGVLI